MLFRSVVHNPPNMNSDLPKVGFVKQVCIDQEIQKGHLPFPDLIKMDIEGAEGDALLGMKEALSKNKPKVFLSLHSEKLQTDCLKLLKDIGYHYKRIDDCGHFQVYAWA